MSEKPLRVIQPVAIPIQFLVQGGIISAFLSFFPAVFALVLSNIIAGVGRFAHGFPGQGPAGFSPIFGWGIGVYLISFLGMMSLLALKYLVEPAKTTYGIYSDRIEYDEGLLNRNHRTLLFDQVIDVQLFEGLFQQTRGVGTITLITQQLVSSGEGKLANRTIQLTNIPEPREVYDLVRSLAIGLNAKRPEGPGSEGLSSSGG
jgi:uncharacterized membrane protein YdbT with pleckstrin-like domain